MGLAWSTFTGNITAAAVLDKHSPMPQYGWRANLYKRWAYIKAYIKSRASLHKKRVNEHRTYIINLKRQIYLFNSKIYLPASFKSKDVIKYAVYSILKSKSLTVCCHHIVGFFAFSSIHQLFPHRFNKGCYWMMGLLPLPNWSWFLHFLYKVDIHPYWYGWQFYLQQYRIWNLELPEGLLILHGYLSWTYLIMEHVLLWP